MKRGLLFSALVAVFAMAFASSAMAATGTGGWLEVCKAAGPANSGLTPSGNFTYTVTDSVGSTTVTVAVGNCSNPFQVAPGNDKIVEDTGPATFVSSIAMENGEQSRLVSSDLSTGTAVVNVPAGDVSTTSTVNYTNVADPGVIEVCKTSTGSPALTGSFMFTLSSAEPGFVGWSYSVTVPVGQCSLPIDIPAGQVGVLERAAATYVTDITAEWTPSSTGIPQNALISSDFTTASSQVFIAGQTAPGSSPDISQESIVTYTDTPVVLKICKFVTGNLGSGPYHFLANGIAVNVSANACEIVPGLYTAGTTVSISEANTPGQYVPVGGIVVSNNRAVPGSFSWGTGDLVTRSVKVVLGSGETVVNYTNSPMDPQTLKVCSTGTSAVFRLKGLNGKVTIGTGGGCAVWPVPLPFHATDTVIETLPSGHKVTGITVAPSDRGSAVNLAAGSVNVLIGTGTTEAQFTNK